VQQVNTQQNKQLIITNDCTQANIQPLGSRTVWGGMKEVSVILRSFPHRKKVKWFNNQRRYDTEQTSLVVRCMLFLKASSQSKKLLSLADLSLRDLAVMN
jgi:hypothetical protein